MLPFNFQPFADCGRLLQSCGENMTTQVDHGRFALPASCVCSNPALRTLPEAHARLQAAEMIRDSDKISFSISSSAPRQVLSRKDPPTFPAAHGPKRWRYSTETMNALTISAFA